MKAVFYNGMVYTGEETLSQAFLFPTDPTAPSNSRT